MRTQVQNASNIHISVVNPKAKAHPPHIHDEEEVFYVLEGSVKSSWGYPYVVIICRC